MSNGDGDVVVDGQEGDGQADNEINAEDGRALQRRGGGDRGNRGRRDRGNRGDNDDDGDAQDDEGQDEAVDPDSGNDEEINDNDDELYPEGRAL